MSHPSRSIDSRIPLPPQLHHLFQNISLGLKPESTPLTSKSVPFPVHRVAAECGFETAPFVVQISHHHHN